MSLRPPPSPYRVSRLARRLLSTVILGAVGGALVWAGATANRIEATEAVPFEEVDLVAPVTLDGLVLNVDQDGIGATPVVLLHDADVAGGLIWDDLAAALGPEATVVRVDLPGFGLSQRITDPGEPHTVTAMAGMVAAVIETRFRIPVLVVGAGLGGEVAAELALSRPELVSGIAMIDVDFWESRGLLEVAQGLPVVSRAVTFAFEAGGPFALERWAPLCDEGGWCPTPAQLRDRSRAVSIAGTTDSLLAHRRTPPASFVPAKLPDITTPSVYLWSSGGSVPRDSAERIVAAIPGARLVVVEAWRAHLEAPDAVAAEVWSLLAP